MTIGIIAAVLIILIVMITFNRVKKQAVSVDRAFADLDGILVQRVDQLDNLIQTARYTADKEIEMFEKVIGLRQGIIDAPNMDEKIKAHNNLTREMPGLMRNFEKYPKLEANKNFMHIQRSINEIEERIQAGRRNFNAQTGKYNQMIATFPSNMVAGVFGFKAKQMFEAPPEKRENVDVKALFSR